MNAALPRWILLAVLAGPLGADDTVRTDLHGDPLPSGALARLGAARLRHGGTVSNIVVLPGEKTLLSSGGDGTVRIWDLKTGKELRRFTHTEAHDPSRGIVYYGNRNIPLLASVSADGKVLVTAMPNGRTISVWDVASGKLTQTFNQTQYLTHLTLSPDGKTIATSSSDNAIRLLDAQGKELRRLGGNDSNARFFSGHGNGLRFSPDSKLLLSMGMDFDGMAFKRVLRGWDVGTGKENFRQEADGNNFPYISMPAFSPNGKLFAAGSMQGEIVLNDAATGKEVRKIKSSIQQLDAVLFARDGKTLIGRGMGSGSFATWEVETGKALKTIGQPAGNAMPMRARGYSPYGIGYAMDVLSDHKTLITGDGNVIRQIDLATGKDLPGALGHAGPVNLLRYSPDGKQLLTQALDGTLRQWDATGKETGQVKVPATAYTFVLSPDGKWLWSQGIDGRALLLDAATGKEVRPINVADGVGGLRFGTATFSPDGKMIALRAQNEPMARLFSTETGKAIGSLGKDGNAGQPFRIYTRCSIVVFSPDSKLAATAGADNNVVVYEVPSGQILREISLGGNAAEMRMRGNVSPLRDLAFAPDGRSLALDLGDNRIVVYEVMSGLERVRYVRRGEAAKANPLERAYYYSNYSFWGSKQVTLSPNGKLLALAGEKNIIHVWDAATGEEIGTFKGHDGEVLALAFSPDSRTLLSGGEDSVGLVWDVSALKPLRTLPTKLDEGLLKRSWDDLSASNGATVFAAVCGLAAAEQTPAYLETQLKPAEAIDLGRIDRLIVDLDARRFPVRKKALEELERAGGRAAPALRRALQGKPSEEMRKRLEELLERTRGFTLTPQQLQMVRAFEALERAGTPAAKAVLEKIARGAEGAFETAEARAVLERIARR